MSRELVAVLRGIKPSEVLSITEVLIEVGFDKIEVTLNSPDPFTSIKLILDEFSQDAIIGAGTVTDIEEVKRLSDMGAKLVVSPNCDASVIRQTKILGMLSYPGVLTPSEAFLALKNDADCLKIFPAGVIGVSGIKALRAVLPEHSKIYAVGGVSDTEFSDYLTAGVDGFGIGTSLYQAGFSAYEVKKRAVQTVRGYDEAFANKA